MTAEGSLDLAASLDAVDGTLAVLRLAQRVHHPAQVPGADIHLEHAARPADLVALVEMGPLTHDHGADVVLFQIEGKRGDGLAVLGRGDLQHLRRHGPGPTIDARDAVLDLEHLADLLGVELFLIALDLGEEHALDLAGAELRLVGHRFP